MNPGSVLTHDLYRPMFGVPLGPWTRWFAWRPVTTIDQGLVWLRPVMRRRVAKCAYIDGGQDFWWQFITAKGA